MGMLRSTASKVAWVGRTASMVFGLALVLALLFGVATMALAAHGGNFVLGVLTNTATDVTRLVGNVPGGPALHVVNNNTAVGSKALQLSVTANKPPLAVNATAGKATNLNADELDGKSSTDFVRYGSVYEVTSRGEGTTPGGENVHSVNCDDGDVALNGDYRLDDYSPSEDMVTATDLHQDPGTPPGASPGFAVLWYDDPSSTAIADAIITVNCADLGTPH